MKFVCLGYYDEKTWETVPQSEQTAMMEECFAYDDVLRKNGHFAGGEALQGARNARTLRYRNGKVTVTDGPYAETKEQLGGYHLVECRDLDEAIAIAQRIPSLRVGGSVEVRALVPALLERIHLPGYHLLPAARADLLRRLGRNAEAAAAYREALALVTNEAERRFLEGRLAEVAGGPRPRSEAPP